jgi:putative chitinase
MFPGYPSTSGSGKIVGALRSAASKKVIVAEGFPSLIQAMEDAQINTPSRVAAFLTTLCFESYCEYNILQGGTNEPQPFVEGSTKNYTGRGEIQLTGLPNYTSAGKYFGRDFQSYPELAQSLEYSARIATWYWTVARHCNPYADAHQMGKVNAAIGYPLSGSNDADRCMVFAKALKYLTGEEPTDVSCTR